MGFLFLLIMVISNEFNELGSLCFDSEVVLVIGMFKVGLMGK